MSRFSNSNRTEKLYWSLFNFVFSYFLDDIGCCLLIYKIEKQKSIYGISIDSQICFMVATFARVCFFTDTQLPNFTVLGLPLGVIELMLAVFLHIYIVLKCLSYQDKELHKKSRWWTRWWLILVVAAALAFVKHPGKKGYLGFTQQFFVSFSMFTEALALVP